MPRRQKDLIQIAMSDPRFRLLSFVEAGFWVHLMHLLLESPTPRQIRFLGSVPASVSRLVSAAEPISETQVETHLATFCELGLIELDPTERTIALAGTKEASRRAEAARINGSAGGRPRKGETLEACRERRQGTLMMPIQGGLAETRETQAESSRAVPTTTDKYTSSSTARAQSGDAALAWELAEIAGISLKQIHHDLGVIAGWRAASISVDDMRQAVRAVAQRHSFDASRVHTLGYFTPAMREAADFSEPRERPEAPCVVINPPRPPAKERDAEGLTAVERAKVEELRAMVRDGIPETDQRRIRLQGFMRHCHPNAWEMVKAEFELAA